MKGGRVLREDQLDKNDYEFVFFSFIFLTSLWADNKSPALFLKKPLCTGDLSRKIFIERPVISYQNLGR